MINLVRHLMSSLPDEVFHPQSERRVHLNQVLNFLKLEIFCLHLAKRTLAGELLVEWLEVTGGLLIQVIPPPRWLMLNKHLTPCQWQHQQQEQEEKVKTGKYLSATRPHN